MVVICVVASLGLLAGASLFEHVLGNCLRSLLGIAKIVVGALKIDTIVEYSIRVCLGHY